MERLVGVAGCAARSRVVSVSEVSPIDPVVLAPFADDDFADMRITFAGVGAPGIPIRHAKLGMPLDRVIGGIAVPMEIRVAEGRPGGQQRQRRNDQTQTQREAYSPLTLISAPSISRKRAMRVPCMSVGGLVNTRPSACPDA